jgi:hypothetical protein
MNDVQASIDPAKVLRVPVTVPNNGRPVQRPQLLACGCTDLVEPALFPVLV